MSACGCRECLLAGIKPHILAGTLYQCFCITLLICCSHCCSASLIAHSLQPPLLCHSLASSACPPAPIWRRAPEVLIDPLDPVTAQCWAPSGGPWAQCRMQLCKPVGLLRRLLFGACANPIKVSCPFPAGSSQVAECKLAGLVQQEVPYKVESVAVKSDGLRLSDEGSQDGLTVPLFP